MNALKLTKYNFDFLENQESDAENIVYEKIFIEGNNLTAYGNLKKWLESQPAEKFYSAWNHKVYPRYTITKIEIN
jgi:hypothetical protein